MKNSVAFLLFLILFSQIAFAQENEEMEETGGVQSRTEEAEPIVDAVNQGGDYDGSPPTTDLSISASSGTAEIPSGSTITVHNGDLTSSNIDSATTKSGLKITSATEATIAKNGDVAFTSAEKLTLNDITIINPKNLQYNHEKHLITFNSADKLVKSNIILTSLKETTIQQNVITTNTEQKQAFQSTIPEGIVEITPAKDAQIIIKLEDNKITYALKKALLTIKNHQQKQILTATGDNQEITIIKTDEGYTTITENSLITISTEQTDERFHGNETYFEWNANEGATFTTLSSPGAYRYTYKELQQDRNGIYARADKTFAQSYEISRQQNLEPYTLFIDKLSRTTGDRDVAIAPHSTPIACDKLDKWFLNTPTNITTPLSTNESMHTGDICGVSKTHQPQVLDKNSAHLSLPTHKLILNGIVNYNRINFDHKTTQRYFGGTWWMEVLPADGSYLPILENNDGTATIQLDSNNVRANITTTSNKYTAYFDDIAITKNNELTRQWITAPFILDTLTITPTLSFKNVPNDSWTVTQFNNALPVAEFHSKQDNRQKLFEKTLKDYQETPCDDLNTKLNIVQETINYLKEAFA